MPLLLDSGPETELTAAEREALLAMITRRRLLGATAGLAALAGAGPRGVGAQDGTPVAGRAVETIHGPVVVPEDPQRIVAINFPSAVALLELGVMPVGISRYLPALPPGYPSTAEIPVVEDEAYELDLEKILGLAPDLIVGSDWKDPAMQQVPYEQLSQIAPTVILEWTMAAGNWAGEAAGCAEAIGKSAELEALRREYEARAEEIKTTYAAVTAAFTWDIISANESNWYLYGPASSHGMVAVAAGIRFGAAAELTDPVVEHSFERFELLQDTGALLVRSVGDSSLTTLPNLATYAGLPAVVAGRMFTSDYFFPSSYGLSTALLADIERGLQALAAGGTASATASLGRVG